MVLAPLWWGLIWMLINNSEQLLYIRYGIFLSFAGGGAFIEGVVFSDGAIVVAIGPKGVVPYQITE
jgi:hypothetical protein